MSPAVLNHTHTAFIPKIRKTKCPADFRPISLYNVAFEVITITIANRLKEFLPLVIDPAQSVFVSGRLITDNALLAYEIFRSMKLNKAIPRGSFAFKLDMSKTYDQVEWDFLESVMLQISVRGGRGIWLIRL